MSDNQAIPSSSAELQTQIKEALDRVIQLTRTGGIILNEVEELELTTLHAEFHSQNGRYDMALTVINQCWKEVETILSPSSSRVKDRRLLRQYIWAAMHYVYIKFIAAVDRKPTEAIQHLTRIGKIITDSLRVKGTSRRAAYEPSGTLSYYYYLCALSQRLQRQFKRAEVDFLNCQEHFYARMIRKLEKVQTEDADRIEASTVDIAYELAYRDVFSAQILSGISSIAIHTGRLKRAQHLLRAARIMLAGTLQQAWQLYVDSLLCIAVRRNAGYESDEYQSSMKGLETCFHEFRNANDKSGQCRCVSELIRGYLDWAEFGRSSERSIYLRTADDWLDTLKKLQPSSSYRLSLHVTRLRLLQKSTELASSWRDTVNLRRNANHHRGSPLLDVGVILAQHTGRAEYNAAEFDRVYRSLIMQLSHSTTDPGDPLLEAECYVSLAQLCVNSQGQRRREAQKYLDRWSAMSQFIDNNYLHAKADIICKTINHNAFTVDFNFILDRDQPLDHMVEEFQRWLIVSLSRRGEATTLAELGAAFGTNRHEMGRRLKTLGLTQTKNEIKRIVPAEPSYDI